MRFETKCVKSDGRSGVRRFLPGLLLSTVLLFGQTGPTVISSTAAIVLDRHSCVPQETIVSSGNVMLEVINRTGLDSMKFHVVPLPAQGTNGTGGNPVLSVGFDNSYLHDDILNLGPGSYQLTVDGHPRWTCTITVQ